MISKEEALLEVQNSNLLSVDDKKGFANYIAAIDEQADQSELENIYDSLSGYRKKKQLIDANTFSQIREELEQLKIQITDDANTSVLVKNKLKSDVDEMIEYYRKMYIG